MRNKKENKMRGSGSYYIVHLFLKVAQLGFPTPPKFPDRLKEITTM